MNSINWTGTNGDDVIYGFCGNNRFVLHLNYNDDIRHRYTLRDDETGELLYPDPLPFDDICAVAEDHTPASAAELIMTAAGDPYGTGEIDPDGTILDFVPTHRLIALRDELNTLEGLHFSAPSLERRLTYRDMIDSVRADIEREEESCWVICEPTDEITNLSDHV